MYAINEDKSYFNLGAFGVMGLDVDSFVPGSTLSDATAAKQLAGKFVRVFPTAGWKIAELTCKAFTEPCLFWDVLHYEAGTGYSGLKDLTEIEQENAELIDSVYFSNDNIYIVLNNMPTAKIWVRIKGE